MSEFIEKRRELSIREYEFMKHLKLFTEPEIREVKNKRFQFEHKVERQTKELSDFINYIAYENNLVELITERRKKLRVRNGKHSLEKCIHLRIKYLYKRAMDRFTNEHRLYTHYLKYCDKYNFTIEGAKILDKMLNHHGDRPKFWINAANWEYTKMNNMERARHFMFRGLQRHPECREMYLSFVELQMKEAQKIIDHGEMSEEEKGAALTRVGEQIEVIYGNYQRKDDDLDFYIELLEMLRKTKVAEEFGIKVLQDMRDTFASKEMMWHTLGKLALEGWCVLHNPDALDDDDYEVPVQERIEKCIEIYETATETLHTTQMWTYYIDSMLILNEDMTSHRKVRRKALADVFKNAYEKNFLDKDKYAEYLQLLIFNDKSQDSVIAEVLENALARFPDSTIFWELNMRYLARKQVSCAEMDELFYKAIKRCKGDLLVLWQSRFQYYNGRTDVGDKVEQMYREAITQPPEVSCHYQPEFLDYLMLNKNMKTVRSEYHEIRRIGAPCLALHRKMAQLESYQIMPDIAHWRFCCETSVLLYGKENLQIWIDYINFERNNGDPKKMPRIFERAKMTLEEDKVETLITTYEMIKQSMALAE